jgi:GntR family transcriptional regulator/MocR family aminotransferase
MPEQAPKRLAKVGAKTEDIFVTRGSQRALDLVARALFSDGGVITVESMGYAPARLLDPRR